MMKIVIIPLVIGVIAIIFGIIFQFQGRGVIGPESSFMYYNRDWIDYGIGIIISGIVLCGIGGLLHVRLRAK